MLNRYLFAFLLGSCIFGALGQNSSSCIPLASQGLSACTASDPSFFSDLGNSGKGGFAILDKMCNATGRAVMDCFFGVFEVCPALMSLGSNALGFDIASMIPFNLTQVMGGGRFGKLCDSMTTIKGCPEIKTCLDKAPKATPNMTSYLNFTQYMDDTTAFNEAKTYLFYQQMFSMICGPFQPMMDCMVTVQGQCSDMMEQNKKQIDSMMPQASSSVEGVKLKFMTFDDMMNLVSQCHLIPQDFGSNECLKEQLMSSEFTTCHQNFSATYSTKAKRQNCNAYVALEGCFINNVEPKCGANTTNVMVRNIPLMVDGLSSSSCETSGSSKPLVTSIMIMMATLFVAMATLL